MTSYNRHFISLTNAIGPNRLDQSESNSLPKSRTLIRDRWVHYYVLYNYTYKADTVAVIFIIIAIQLRYSIAVLEV